MNRHISNYSGKSFLLWEDFVLLQPLMIKRITKQSIATTLILNVVKVPSSGKLVL